MLQPSTLLRSATRRHTAAASRAAEGVLALPLEVILRRMQSSSTTNPARGLAAHFQVPEAPLPQDGTDSTVSEADLRHVLSHRLLASLRGNDAAAEPSRGEAASVPFGGAFTDAFHKKPDKGTANLSLDEISLILANALRHNLSADLVRTSFKLFSATMDDAQRAGATSLFFDGATMELKKAESLTRVVEACVAAADSTALTEALAGDGGLDGLTTDMWASMAGWIAVRWGALASHPSTASLLLQFYAVAIEQAGRSSSTEPSGSFLSFPALQTDPTLLREHCYKQSGKALESLLEGYTTSVAQQSGHGNQQGSFCRSSSTSVPRDRTLSRPTELVRLSEAALRLGAYEKQVVAAARAAAGGGASTATAGVTMGPSLSVSHLTIAASASASAVAWRRWWQSGRRRREQKHALLHTPVMSLSSQLGALVADHAVPLRSQRAAGRNARSSVFLTSGSVPGLSIYQAATIFSAVSDSVSASAAADWLLHLGEMLRSRRENGGLSTEKDAIAGVLVLGEACLRHPDGTLTVLTEVLRCLQSVASVLVQLAFGPGAQQAASTSVRRVAETSGKGSTHLAPLYTLWPRACELVEHVPLSLGSTAEVTFNAFANAFLERVRSFGRTGPPADREASFRHGRYGVFIVAWHVAHGQGPTPQRKAMELQVRRLARSLPFTSAESDMESRVEMKAAVRALSVLTASPPSSPRRDAEGHEQRDPHALEAVGHLLEELGSLLRPGNSSREASPDGKIHQASRTVHGLGLGSLTANERAMLREALRVVRDVTVAPQTAERVETTGPPAETTSSVASGSGAARARTLDPLAAPLPLTVFRGDPEVMPLPRQHSTRRLPSQGWTEEEVDSSSPAQGERERRGSPSLLPDALDDSHQLEKELTQLSHDLHRRLAYR